MLLKDEIKFFRNQNLTTIFYLKFLKVYLYYGHQSQTKYQYFHVGSESVSFPTKTDGQVHTIGIKLGISSSGKSEHSIDRG